MSVFRRFLIRTLPPELKVRLRPYARAYEKAIRRMKYPLRVIHIFPYVWRTEIRERMEYVKARAAHEAEYTTPSENPPISIIIPTYNRAELLMTRAVPSILAQTYQNFEVIIVGEHCTDDTGERLARLGDPRIRFQNLPERPPYPDDEVKRWMVIAYSGMNTGRQMAEGLWMASMDDDDVWMPHHLESLLRFAQENDLEFASSQSLAEIRPGEYRIKGRQPALSMREKTHCTYFARTYLRVFSYEPNSWRAQRSIDKHMLGKLRRAGVRAGFLEQVTAYYLLGPQSSVRTSA